MKYILSLDQGTTGTTVSLIDSDTFQFAAKVNHEFPQIYPSPGWVEHDLLDIWASVKSTIDELFSSQSVTAEQIIAIGLTNQRETTCAFDRSGVPLHNAIVWQDRRTADYCDAIKNSSSGRKIQKLTGLPVDPYFSASKMRWLLDNSPAVQAAQAGGSLCFGTIDTFLLYKLTNGQSYFTDTTNASRTLLMNLKDCQWDKTLLNKFGITQSSLPRICPSFHNFGVTNGLDFLPDGIPITGILGDQQAALFGQAGYKTGSLKCTYGTGAFLLLNTGRKIPYSKSGLLSTVAFSTSNETTYALEGSSFIAGAAVQWLRDNLKIIEKSPDIEKLASKVTDLSKIEHLTFLPFFTGIGSPHWKPEAKGAIVGITRDTGPEHIAHSCLQGIALSINDLIQVMRKDASIDIAQIRVDGGASSNDLLMKLQAILSNTKVLRPRVTETTGYGAGLAAAIGAGKITFDDLDTHWSLDATFEPDSPDASFYEKKRSQWQSYISRLFF